MSVQALSCAIAMTGITASEKLLLLVMANYADEHMKCWPSHRRMAHDTCLSERSILSLLKSLEAKGMIARDVRYRADGSRASDVITLYFSGEIVSPRGEDGDTGVGKSATLGGEAISPLTSFEPSKETGLADASPTPQRGKRIPENWSPSEADVEFALGEGLSIQEIDRGACEFRDYWRARTGSGATKRDWSATWRNRVRELADRGRRRGAGVAPFPGQSGGDRRGSVSFADIFVRRHGNSSA